MGDEDAEILEAEDLASTTVNATANAPSPPSSQLSLPAEAAILRLLQRASRSPEDLIEGAIELSLMGLVSRTTLGALCNSVGLGDAQKRAVLDFQMLTLTRRQTEGSADSGRPAPSPSLFFGADSAASAPVPPAIGPISIGSLLEGRGGTTALSLPSAALGPQPGIAPVGGLGALVNPRSAAAFGLGTFNVGSRLASEFELLEKLGRGGGGAVYRARHHLDGSEYAIKRVLFWTRPGAPAHSELSAQRVLREVRALARLNHPNVCRYYSAWIETDWPSFLDNMAAPRAASGAGASAWGTAGAGAPRVRLIKSNVGEGSGRDGQALDEHGADNHVGEESQGEPPAVRRADSWSRSSQASLGASVQHGSIGGSSDPMLADFGGLNPSHNHI